MSAWFVAALLVCGLVGAQSLPGGTEGNMTFNDDYETEDTSWRVNTLKRSSTRQAGSPGVAFSAVLSDSGTKRCLNPKSPTCFSTRRVITNVGEAYDPDTGVFTAPVRGLYYFLLNRGAGSSRSSDAALLKNSHTVDDIYNTRGSLSSVTNGVTLDLEPGDQTSTTTSANRGFRGPGGLSTFSSFLISSM